MRTNSSTERPGYSCIKFHLFSPRLTRGVTSVFVGYAAGTVYPDWRHKKTDAQPLLVQICMFTAVTMIHLGGVT